ncbi:MAG: class I SAM-dependent methyltransferase [Saprospiraceae bacterium]|nr:class I SAM-dependent methyltransferase [Saprospiraceae bacterium]
MKQWFKSWFDSPFYHILYKERDINEAKHFIDQLVNKLKIKSNDKILDLACGSGRHSIYLNELGFDVCGLDLSTKSIDLANQSKQSNLEFFVHDMRKPFRINYFDYVFNFFTSFGYFEKQSDNINTFKNIHSNLKEGGIFVIDYFNAHYVEQNFKSEETIVKNDISFKIKRFIENNKIIKTIQFEKNGENFDFIEKVSLFKIIDFQNLADVSGLKMVATYGSYDLEDYDENNSLRLIIIFKKN